MSNCRYCGSVQYGAWCFDAPSHMHEHDDDERHCVWCGSLQYGGGCAHSPVRENGMQIHRHGRGGPCTWCGSNEHGAGCPHSPSGSHEHGWLLDG